MSACEHLLATRESWVDPALGILGGGPIYAVAPAERLSSAERSALMFREAPRIFADACETGDWPYPGSGDPLVPLLVETTVAEFLAAEMWARSAAG